MKCVNCGRELFDSKIFNKSSLSDLFNNGRFVYNQIEMLYGSGMVYFVCPFCYEQNLIDADDFLEMISSNPSSSETSGGASGGGYSGGGYSGSTAGVASATTPVQTTPAAGTESKTPTASTGDNQDYYEFDNGSGGGDNADYSNYKRDIDLPTPAVIDYTTKKIGELKETVGNFLSGALAGFSTMGLPGLPNVSSIISKANSLGGGNSNLETIHTNLKNIESKLRDMDPNYDLYVAIGYLDNLGTDSIIGSRMSTEERDAIFGKITDTLENNKGKFSVDSKTESDILAASIKASMSMGDTSSAIKNATKLQTEMVEGVINTLLKDYAGVTYIERNEGGLLIEKANAYSIGVPPNFQGPSLPMDTIIFFDDGGSYGPGGSKQYNNMTHGSLDRSNYRSNTGHVDTLMTKNPNTIVAASYADAGKNIIEMLDVMKKIGVTSNHTVVSGFSAGGNAAVTTAANICQNYSNLKNVEMLMLDTNNLNDIRGNAFQILAQNGVKATTLNSIGTSNQRILKNRYQQFFKNGIDVTDIKAGRTENQRFITFHTDHKIMAFNDNLFGYVLGTLAAPANTNAAPSFNHAPYSYYHYDQTSGKFESGISPSRQATQLSAQFSGGSNTSNGASTNWNYGTKVTEAQLKQAFPDASSIRHNNNGVYEVRFAGDTLFVPDNASLENMNVVALWPGNNGAENDPWIGKTVNGSSNTCVFNGHNITSAKRLENIINNNNVHVSNAQLSIYSASGSNIAGFRGLDQLAGIINNTKGNVDNYQVVSYDGSSFGQNASSSTINTLLQSGTQVYVVASSGGGHPTSMMRNAQTVSSTGVPTYFIQTGSSNHEQVVYKAFTNNVPMAIMGQGSIYNLNGYTSSKV